MWGVNENYIWFLEPNLLVEAIRDNGSLDPSIVARISLAIRDFIGDNGIFNVRKFTQEVTWHSGDEMLNYWFVNINSQELYKLFEDNLMMHNIMVDLPDWNIVNVFVSSDE